MKKITSFILALVLGMSVSPLVSLSFAQDYDPSELYQEFLRQLQSGGTGVEQPTVVPQPQPESETFEVVQPTISEPRGVEREVRVTGRVVKDGEVLSLLVKVNEDTAAQIGNTFVRKISHDPTSWYYKKLRLYSHDKDINPLLIRAAVNDLGNRVMLGGSGIPSPEGILMGISLNEGAYVNNIKDPGNPNFDKLEVAVPAPFQPSYTDHYGFITTRNERAYMNMTDSNGNPLVDENGRQVERIMYNSEIGTMKWKSPFIIANVDYKDTANDYLIRASAFIGMHGDLKYIRYTTLDMVRLYPAQRVTAAIQEPAPAPAPAPTPAPEPEPTTESEQEPVTAAVGATDTSVPDGYIKISTGEIAASDWYCVNFNQTEDNNLKVIVPTQWGEFAVSFREIITSEVNEFQGGKEHLKRIDIPGTENELTTRAESGDGEYCITKQAIIMSKSTGDFIERFDESNIFYFVIPASMTPKTF